MKGAFEVYITDLEKFRITNKIINNTLEIIGTGLEIIKISIEIMKIALK